MNILVSQCKYPRMNDECWKDNDIHSEDEVDIYLLREKAPLVKPRSGGSTSQMAGHDQRFISGIASQIDANGSLQSWLDNDNKIVNASIPESFRCLIAGASECGKIFLLNNLILSSIQFDRLYIIGPTGDQYEDLKYEHIVFKKINDLPSPNQLPKDIKKLMMFDDVGEGNQLLMKTFVEVDTVIVI